MSADRFHGKQFGRQRISERRGVDDGRVHALPNSSMAAPNIIVRVPWVYTQPSDKRHEHL